MFAETCPQYLFLTAKDIDRGLDGAMFCCSPPPRDEAAQQACWDGLCDGTLALYSSDHAPYRFDASGKLPKGDKTTFKEMANGVPGLELRLPLLVTYGVGSGHISINEFVRLLGARGRGRFLPRARTNALTPAGLQIPELAQLSAWGTPLES